MILAFELLSVCVCYVYNVTYRFVVYSFLGISRQFILLFISLFSIQPLRQLYNIIGLTESIWTGEAGDLAGVTYSTHLSLPLLTMADNVLTAKSTRPSMTILPINKMVAHLMQQYA